MTNPVIKTFQTRVRKTLLYLFLTLVAVTMLLPLWWMFATAVSGPAALEAGKFEIWPRSFHWSNFTAVFRQIRFGRFYLNSVLVTAIITGGQVLTSAMAAFAFARLRFRGRDRLFMLYLATLMIPGTVTIIPTFILIVWLGWYNSLTALIVPSIFSAYGTFLLRQFFQTIPGELDEAALIDGCSYFQIFWYIILPLSRPALATLAIFTILGSWKNFIWPLIVIVSTGKKTLPIGIVAYQGMHSTQWNLLMAASLMMIAPIILAFVLCQKQFISGLQIGGLKG